MARSRVGLYHRPQQQYIRVTNEFPAENTIYFLRYRDPATARRVWERLEGRLNAKTAQAAVMRKEAQMLEREADGGEAQPRRKRLVDAQARFLASKQNQRHQGDGAKLDKETLQHYQNVISDFVATSSKAYVDQLEKEDLNRYIATVQERGKSWRTVCNYYSSVATSLRYVGGQTLGKGERPTFRDDAPEAYKGLHCPRQRTKELLILKTNTAARVLQEYRLCDPNN